MYLVLLACHVLDLFYMTVAFISCYYAIGFQAFNRRPLDCFGVVDVLKSFVFISFLLGNPSSLFFVRLNFYTVVVLLVLFREMLILLFVI